MMTEISERRYENTTETNGKELVLKYGTGVGNGYTMRLLRDMEFLSWIRMGISDTTDFEAYMDVGDRNWNNLLSISIYDKENDESYTRTSKYC